VIDKKNAGEIDDWRQRLLDWFAVNQRPLPWRTTYTPYHIWISEIMGQQTQIERVAHYFTRWIERFPDLAAVAAAPEQSILKAWEGLGYYSRARNLQRAAARLVEAGTTDIPADYQQLLALPGIGPYTAAAILSIAFNQPYPLLDANVERLFARLADIDRPLKQGSTKKQLAAMAEILLDRENPRQYNQALMELGALVCTPKKPACITCPVQIHCRAHRADTVDFRPCPAAGRKKSTSPWPAAFSARGQSSLFNSDWPTISGAACGNFPVAGWKKENLPNRRRFGRSGRKPGGRSTTWSP
jgi:A/G-specific adenine glycosylase